MVVVKRHMSAVLEADVGWNECICIEYFGQEFGGSKGEDKGLG